MRSRKAPRGDELHHPATGTVLAQAWIRTYCPNATVLPNHYLGPLTTNLPPDSLDPSEQRLAIARRPRVQYLAVQDHEMVLVEGVIQPTREKVLRLADLKELVPKTPELANEQGRRVRAVLCCRDATNQILVLARRKRVEIQIPEWNYRQPETSPTYIIGQPLGNIENGVPASEEAGDTACITADPDGKSPSSGE